MRSQSRLSAAVLGSGEMKSGFSLSPLPPFFPFLPELVTAARDGVEALAYCDCSESAGAAADEDMPSAAGRRAGRDWRKSARLAALVEKRKVDRLKDDVVLKKRTRLRISRGPDWAHFGQQVLRIGPERARADSRLSSDNTLQRTRMSQAPPPVANSGEDAITRVVDVAPEAFADDQVSLEDAYEVAMTLAEIAKGDYQRVWMYLEAVKEAADAVWYPRSRCSFRTSSCTTPSQFSERFGTGSRSRRSSTSWPILPMGGQKVLRGDWEMGS